MSDWRARRANKKRLKGLQKQRVVAQEKCYLCGSLVTVEPGLAEQAIRPAFPDAKGALSHVHVCSACLRRVTTSYGTVDERACLWLTIPEAERYVAWRRDEKPSAEQGAGKEAAATPPQPPPPAAEESPEDRLLRAVAKYIRNEAQPSPKPRPTAQPPQPEKPHDIALAIAETAAGIIAEEGDMDGPTLRARLPPEARDKMVWGRVVRRLNLHSAVVVTEINGVKLFAPKREET